MRFLAIIALFAGALAAQPRTWIVDARNGPGTDFTDLPPCVVAAATGDTILVRPGGYGWFATSKGLAILGQGGRDAVVIERPFERRPWDDIPVVHVHDLPAGASFVLSNLSIPFEGLQTGVLVERATGQVHIGGVRAVGRVTFAFGLYHEAAALDVRDSAAVTLESCDLSGRSAIDVLRTWIAVSGSMLVGSDSSIVGGHQPCCTGAGIWGEDARIHVARTTVVGGAGLTAGFFTVPGSAGILLRRGFLWIGGDGRDLIRAGINPFPQQYPVSAVSAGGADVEVDPAVQLVPEDGGDRISGAASIRTRRLASVLARGGPPGGALAGEVVSQPDSVFVLMVGAPQAPRLTPFGSLLVDPARSLVSVPAQQSASGAHPFAIPVPPSIPAGSVLALHAVALAPNAVLLSAPAAVAVR